MNKDFIFFKNNIKKTLKYFYSFFFGISLVICFPPFNFWPLLFPSLTFIFLKSYYAESNKDAFLIGWFFGLSFFSKQVPGSYIIIPLVIIIIFYSIIKKELNPIKYSCLGSLIFIVLVILIGTIQEISLNAFLTQYINYPQNIADNRFDNFNFSINGFFNHYKFIFLAIFPLIYLNIKNLINNKKYNIKINS